MEKYEVVTAPLLYMTKGNTDEKIRQFVKKGGTFITSYFSGIVDEHDLVITGGYPGKLRDWKSGWRNPMPFPGIRETTLGMEVFPVRRHCCVI